MSSSLSNLQKLRPDRLRPHRWNQIQATAVVIVWPRNCSVGLYAVVLKWAMVISWPLSDSAFVRELIDIFSDCC